MRLTKDNVVNAVCIIGIIVSICFMLIVILKSFYAQKIDISFIKDIFSIGTTLAASLIAISLFNDWKEQHNLQVLAHEAKEAFHLFHLQRDIIHNLKYQISGIISGENKVNISEKTIAVVFQEKLIKAYNLDKDKMSAFCFLSEGQNLYDITMEYYKAIHEIGDKLVEKANQPFSDTRFLDKHSSIEFLAFIESLEAKNTNILKELKSYIFFH
ncbi:hypothetical protein [Acinetobacter baumannii]|uniref:hypothetical protein n=1 Tax=Acinetobacter baumannii TaxID=470 RepID=UPI000AC9A8CF|nr:hypothetical protein [Acinetobacter baumannii]MCZ3283918.1 hypothetical protein [Acinetobacter baumannii]MDA3521980.1 hypothetical protein [Acinetobacter baumannii]MDI9691078.1 hypothetical protein [Acinetobacter baumannii]UJX48172.1 hypothetical protein HUF98_07575 [Acinetobacter baumannii]HEE5426213.1 hypothetical protein [Acinetobacter baumannii]